MHAARPLCYTQWLDAVGCKTDFPMQVAAHDCWLWNELFYLNTTERRIIRSSLTPSLPLLRSFLRPLVSFAVGLWEMV